MNSTRLKGESHIGRYRIGPGDKVRLNRLDPDDTSGFEGGKEDAQKESANLLRGLEELQEILYAEFRSEEGRTARAIQVLAYLYVDARRGDFSNVIIGV